MGYGERLFQAARFVTEMQYQHLVFEEFARKVQPQVNLFAGYHTEINPAISAEFAHTVYRFGHSMLTETVARSTLAGTIFDIPLLNAFLNPLSFNQGPGGTLSASAAAGSIFRGMADQLGNELDEFVTEALRNRLLGLPLDLATINMARGRSEGIPRLQAVRQRFFNQTGNSALAPYQDWADFGLGLRHPESLVNFVAAYGRHPSIENATTLAAKRRAADQIVNGTVFPGPDGVTGDDPNTSQDESLDDITPPADSQEFMTGTAGWAPPREPGLGISTFGSAASPRPRPPSAACSAPPSTMSSRPRWSACRTATGSITCRARPGSTCWCNLRATPSPKSSCATPTPTACPPTPSRGRTSASPWRTSEPAARSWTTPTPPTSTRRAS